MNIVLPLAYTRTQYNSEAYVTAFLCRLRSMVDTQGTGLCQPRQPCQSHPGITLLFSDQ